MFCGKEAYPHILDCACHTPTDTTTFTYDDLYTIYIVMLTIDNGKDIFGTLVDRLRRLIIMPTRMFICLNHRKVYAAIKSTVPRLLYCGRRCIHSYIGCVNDHTFAHPESGKMHGINFKMKHLMANCYNSYNTNIKCPELAVYFPEYHLDVDNDSSSSSDSSDHCCDWCNKYMCECGSDYSDEW